MGLDPLSLGLAAGSLVGRAIFGRPKAFNPARINAKWMAYKPKGWLNPEDYAFTNRQQSGANDIAAARARARSSDALRRFSLTPGGGFNPAFQAVQGGIERDRAAATEANANNAEDTLFKIQQGREGFDQQRALTAWGSELEAGSLADQRGRANTAEFWNSIGDLTQNLGSHFSGAAARNPNAATASETALGITPADYIGTNRSGATRSDLALGGASRKEIF